MRDRIAKTTALVAVFFLSATMALGDRREIEFPIADGYFPGDPGYLGFTPDGKLGFATVYNRHDGSDHLFSFSVAERRVIDGVNLSQDFGSGSVTLFMKAHTGARLIAFYGTTHRAEKPDHTQIVLAVAYDEAGRFSRKWSISYTPASGLYPGLAFSGNGARIYAIYTDAVRGLPSESPALAQRTITKTSVSLPMASVQRVDLIRSEDGVVLSSADLPGVGEFVAAVYDDADGRAIVLAGTSAHIFSALNDTLKLEAVIGPVPELGAVDLPVISADGRFVVAYAGFAPDSSGSDGSITGANQFVSYDLELKTPRTFSIKDTFFPFLPFMTFHRPTNTLLVPLSGSVRQE